MKRLVVALLDSANPVSQEWLTTIVRWTFVSGPKPRVRNSECENVVYPPDREACKLEMKNVLPYLSKKLFWLAMEDIARNATLVSGHSWQELQNMLDDQAHEPQPQIYSIKAVTVPEAPLVVFSQVATTKHFFQPWKARLDVIAWLKELHPSSNPNRGRLSGTAQSLTFGAQTGRGSDRSCVIKRTTDYQYRGLIDLVHQLAQDAVGPALPYLGFQILRLGVGQNLNEHRDYHNHPDYPNHTMKFGKYKGGSLQMLRDGAWSSYDKENQWLSFDALKVVHQVTAVTWGERYSITLCTPGKMERLTAQDLDILAKEGFPIYLYKPLPAKMRRLATPSHVVSLTPASERIQTTLEHKKADASNYYSRSTTAVADRLATVEEKIWDNIPLPSIADPTDSHLLKPKTLVDCCRCAQDFMEEHDLRDSLDAGEINLMRVHGHWTRMMTQFAYLQSAAERRDKHCYLWCLVNIRRLACCMTNEAGMETVLSAT